MNNETLHFRFYDSNASGSACRSALPESAPAVFADDEDGWLDEDQIMAGIRESVRSGRPVAEIFRAMRRA